MQAKGCVEQAAWRETGTFRIQAKGAAPRGKAVLLAAKVVAGPPVRVDFSVSGVTVPEFF